MNILYCGDQNIEDGLVISVLSLLEHTAQPLHIYVLTLDWTLEQRRIRPLCQETADYLDRYVRQRNPDNFLRLIDATELFRAQPPLANMDTRFTPCCMLRLYADQIPELPERLLYLDNDVVCRGDFAPFYNQDLADCELAGVLDHYGRWFFRRNPLHMDYINSGVLLLDLGRIRQTGLFAACRALCRDKRMFMPDQSAINKLAQGKKQCPRAYNEQRRLREDTVFQHFTTSFRFFPWPRTLTVKPWQIDRVHEKLHIFEYDDLLRAYTALMADMKG